MYAAKRCFLRLFTFESDELRSSYSQFQKNNEDIMLSFCNILFIPSAVIILAFGIFNQLSYERIALESSLLSGAVIAFFIRKKYPIIQKMLLIGFVGVSETVFMLNNGFSDHNSDFLDRFLIGNGFGLTEMVLILSLKFMSLRCAVFTMFIAIKLILLLYQTEIVEDLNIAVLVSVFLILIFLLVDNVLDRRIFRIVYESKDKQKKFETLLSKDLPLSVVIISPGLSKILYSNDFFKQKFKRQDEALNGQEMDFQVFGKFNVNRILDTELQEEYNEATLLSFLQKIHKDFELRNDETVITLSVTYRDKDESEFHYEIKVRKIIWEENPSYAMVLHDVSDKERVIALKLADEQKDRVVATVSHELRTPINGILGLLEMMLARTSDAVSLEYIDYAKSCSKLLLYLVNSILDLSQLRNNCLRISKTSFNINRFLEELRSLYIFHSQQKGIDFKILVEPEVPKDIYTDKYRLIQILINLLGNAMKFTFYGSITLNISIDENDSQKLMFCIEDTGIGIKEEDKPKLFKMFGKLNQNDKSINSQGVGLGLTIANELVKVLNDKTEEERIHFESEYGKGTKFWFRVDAFIKTCSLSNYSELNQHDDEISDLTERSIESSFHFKKRLTQYSAFSRISSNMRLMKFSSPRKDEENEENNEISDKNGLMLSPISPHRHVLLVDDSPFNLMAASFILEQLGFTCQQSFNGQQGLDFLIQSQISGKQYCMILTDVQMPILDGIEMSKSISQKIKDGELYNVPIIAITAKKLSDQEKIRYKNCGISYTMEKPLILQEMKSILVKLGLLEQLDTNEVVLKLSNEI